MDDLLLDTPIHFLPPTGCDEWPEVDTWTDGQWRHWMMEHNKYPFLRQWTDGEITHYLTTDRYRYGVGVKRAANAPFHWFYKPTPVAVPFHSSKVPNILFGGAAGGSKSHSARHDAYRHCFAIPEFRAIIMRRTFEELKRNHLDKARTECERMNAYFGKEIINLITTEHEIRVDCHGAGRESKIIFGHCQNLGDEEKYLGDAYDAFYPDEMATFERKQIIGIAGRLRSEKRGIVARLGGTSNPGGAHTLWLKDYFIDKDEAAIREENPRYRASRYQFIQAMLYDNPYYMDPDGTYTNYEERLFAYDPERRRQLLLGDWTALAGQFFPEFNPYRHVAHLPIPAGCKIERWIDWGYDPHYGVCLWVACLPNGRLYVFYEWKFNGAQAREKLVAANVAQKIRAYTADEVLPLVKSNRITRSIADPSMWSADGHSGEDYSETFARNGVPLMKADNDRVMGWGRLRHWLRLAPDGMPWLMFHPRCTTTIRTIPGVVRDKSDPDDIDCWVAGTMISTPSGDMPIESVRPGDKVYTPVGPRRVLQSYLSGASETTWALLEGGQLLKGTPHHKVYVRSKGLVALEDLKCDDILQERTIWSNLLNIVTWCIAGIRAVSTTPQVPQMLISDAPVFIDRSGWTQVRSFLEGGMSTIRIMIMTIMTSQIWSASLEGFTVDSTCESVYPVSLDSRSRGGVARSLDNRFLERMHKRCGRGRLNGNARATIVACLSARDTLGKYFAQINAKRHQITLSRPLAWCVAVLSGQSEVAKSKCLPARIVAVGRCEDREPVYNLTIEDAHLFYANGILSSNTNGEDHPSDTVRYGIMARPTPTVMRLENPIILEHSVAAMLRTLEKPTTRKIGMVS